MASPFAAVTSNKRFDVDEYVEGYATTFNDPYVLCRWGDWEYREEIDPNAFEGADMTDVIMQYDHAGRVFARQSNGTLLLEPDHHGLFIAGDLSSTSSSRSLHEDIAAGLITRMSWAFTVAEQEDKTDYDNKVFTTRITRVSKVFDVSAVSRPADPNTEISARSYIDGVIEARKQQELLARNEARMRLALRAKALGIR